MNKMDLAEADIVVIGAGPKAAAIAAKVHVLNTLGLAELRVAIVERFGVASSWTGKHGYTSGKEELGTSPNKDVGFPYQSLSYGEGNRPVDLSMMEYSWQTYLVAHDKYRKWVDAGCPHSSHAEFAHYISWVTSRAINGISMHQGEVIDIAPTDSGWNVVCRELTGASKHLLARKGVVITGPGIQRELPCVEEIRERVFTAASRNEISPKVLGPNSRICVIGFGESAASMALHLVGTLGPEIELAFVAPSLRYSRAESYFENTVYSDSQIIGWEQLCEQTRSDFISQTDRGVMSPAAAARLTRHDNLSFIVGRVTRLIRSATGRIAVVVDQKSEELRLDFDAVANCTGFDSLSMLNKFLGKSKRLIEKRLGFGLDDEHAVSLQLDRSFALCGGLMPRIHLPGLAGLQYGPGFCNLSCLGTLSDRILSPYWGSDESRTVSPTSASTRLLESVV